MVNRSEAEVASFRELTLGVAPYLETPVRRKRRNRRSKGMEWVAAAAALVALAGPAVVFVRGSQRLVSNRGVNGHGNNSGRKGSPNLVAPDSPREFDLVVPEAYFVKAGDGRRIRGVVRNNGKVGYRKVEVFFGTDDRDFKPVRVVSAILPNLLPGDSASFETDSVPLKATRHHIKEIGGDKIDTLASATFR
jgi:hypothetical protein